MCVFWTEYGKELLRLVTFLYGVCHKKAPSVFYLVTYGIFQQETRHINYSNPCTHIF